MENKQRITFDISFSAILKVVGVLMALFFIFLLRQILIIFIVALILATLINPLADMFARRRIPRALAVLLIYLFLLGFIALIATILIPPLLEEAGQLVKYSSGHVKDFINKISYFKELPIAKDIIGESDAGIGSVQAGITTAISGVFNTVTGFLGGIVAFMLILVLTFYMVVEDTAVKKFFRDVAPAAYQPQLVGLITRAQNKIGMWLRGALLLGLIVGSMEFVALKIVGVKYALVLAILGGILELIPYIGPPISAVPAVFLALADSPIKGFFILIAYVVVQRIENDFLVPRVMKKFVGINPIVSIMSLGVGFELAGPLGALLAIPVATAGSVFVADIIELKKQKELSQ
jgi:predicted PurR-regulated permease PerM